MRIRLMTVVVAWLAAGAGCSNDSTGGEPFPSAHELMAADRAFAEASARHGAEAWSDIWADRGMLYSDGEDPAVGPLAAGRSVSGVVDDLRWEPTSSAMLWPDALGYTVGRWWLASDGQDADAEQRYLTVWKRVDGDWKVALDLSLPAQETTSDATDFDFWLGDWTLEQRIWSGDGDEFEPYAARNQVRTIEDGGALVENFAGNVRFFWLGMDEPAPIRGFSVRVYYPDAREWRIFWMDTLEPRFGPPFSGGFSGDVGEFLLTDRPTGIPPSRIRFERQPDDSVDWQLALRTPDGESWQPLWFIEFRRADGDEPAD